MKTKKIILIILMTTLSAFVFADKKSDIAKLLKVSGSIEMVDQIVDALMPQYKQILPDVPDEVWNKFAKKLKESGPAELTAGLIPVYDKYFSESEIKELIKFYESPIGKKMVKNQPLIMQDSMKVGEEWGMKIGQQIAEELKSEGYIK